MNPQCMEGLLLMHFLTFYDGASIFTTIKIFDGDFDGQHPKIDGICGEKSGSTDSTGQLLWSLHKLCTQTVKIFILCFSTHCTLQFKGGHGKKFVRVHYVLSHPYLCQWHC